MKRKTWFAGLLFLLCFLFLLPIQADAAKDEWVEKGGCRYYYNNQGEPVKGRLKQIGEDLFYFDGRGRMVKNTMKVIRGDRYYFRGDGKAKSGWVNFKGEKYYFDSEYRGAEGLTQIGKKRYFFAEDGSMRTGWQFMGKKKAYFYQKTGKMAVNRTIDGQKIGRTGLVKLSRADKAMIKAEKKAEKILKKITREGMSKSEKLRAIWNYMTSHRNFSYVTWQPFTLYDGWEYDYAIQIYDKRGGNCHNFACGFAVMAKVIGHEAYVIRGRVHGSRDGAPDGFTRHTFVKIDGLYYDPELHFAGSALGIYGYKAYPLTHQILGIRKI